MPRDTEDSSSSSGSSESYFQPDTYLHNQSSSDSLIENVKPTPHHQKRAQESHKPTIEPLPLKTAESDRASDSQQRRKPELPAMRPNHPPPNFIKLPASSLNARHNSGRDLDANARERPSRSQSEQPQKHNRSVSSQSSKRADKDTSWLSKEVQKDAALEIDFNDDEPPKPNEKKREHRREKSSSRDRSRANEQQFAQNAEKRVDVAELSADTQKGFKSFKDTTPLTVLQKSSFFVQEVEDDSLDIPEPPTRKAPPAPTPQQGMSNPGNGPHKNRRERENSPAASVASLDRRNANERAGRGDQTDDPTGEKLEQVKKPRSRTHTSEQKKQRNERNDASSISDATSGGSPLKEIRNESEDDDRSVNGHPQLPRKNPSILRRGSKVDTTSKAPKSRQKKVTLDEAAVESANLDSDRKSKTGGYGAAARLDENAPLYDHSISIDINKSQSRKQSTTSIKHVAIDGGKFVHEVPVSRFVMEGGKYDGTEPNGEEFTRLRYTAITCEPDDFVKEEYLLRQTMFDRKIKIAVVITMYNEDDILFCRSFRAIMKNIADLCSGRALWTPDSWKEVLVVIVSDGRAKVNPKVLDVLSILGVYMPGLVRDTVEDVPVKAHMFEFTTQSSVDPSLERRGMYDSKDGITLVPCQTIFLLKEKNAKKINSHRWFFNAICESLQPNVCVLLDVGTKPTKESLFHLYNAFHFNENVGGACGEVAAELGKHMENLWNPLVAVQNFEYKMSNILDKPLESVFGYISVLPGAFSAYRFEALKGAPLACYFKGETPHGENVAEANMYLAEDRILCFELVMKQDKSWLLKYVKSARADTDVPTELDDLISQRRRWLNGSFFAAVYATSNWMRIFQSKHSTLRKWILLIEFGYNFINLVFQWFNIGNFYLSFYFLFGTANSAAASAGIDPFYPNGAIVFGFVNEIYLCLLISIFVLSLGNRPQGSKALYLIVSATFSLLMLLMLFMALWSVRLSIMNFQQSNAGFIEYANSTPSFRDIIISMATVYGAYFVSSLLHADVYHCITCILQYMFLLPTYVNVFMVYAFCNIHDVTWGTKGDNKPEPAGGVKTQTTADGKTIAMVEVPDDVDTLWQEVKIELDRQAFLIAKKRNVTPPSAPDQQTQHDDFFKQFRTRVVLGWVLSNAVLVFIFTNESILSLIFPTISLSSSVNPYLTFLFWSVTFIAIFRFLFSAIYICGWIDENMRDSGKRRPFAEFRRRFAKVTPSADVKT
ncbi:chitin synthase [Chytriomyces confervae]|uniref:chitin synthase n=1 Tax=Chytriomyces confervae TaxID=246404 RepID=A0A507FHC7_9FUNG|nr:chitin synthase [Chytriomyces confervae]